MGVVHVDFVLMWETDYSDGSKGSGRSGRSGLILSILDNKSHLETNQGQVFFTSSPDLIAELKEGSIPVALSPDVVDIQEVIQEACPSCVLIRLSASELCADGRSSQASRGGGGLSRKPGEFFQASVQLTSSLVSLDHIDSFGIKQNKPQWMSMSLDGPIRRV